LETSKVKSGSKIPGIIFTVIYAMLLTGVGYVGGKDTAELIQYGVFSIILGGLVSLCIRKYFPVSVTDPDISEKSESRFWIIVYICMLLSVLFSYFPNTMWVFVPVFVILSLFSSPLVGIVIASVLLAGTAMISGCGALVFFLYFVSGVFSVMVYLPLTEEIKFAMPAFLSSLCLLVCEMCGIILTINSAFDIQLLILPFANCLIGMMVIYSAFRGYSSLIMFKYYDLYQTLCDTENEKLLELRSESPKEYMLSIHTAYFCDRVSSSIGLDADIVKCAGYYHELTPGGIEDREDFYREMGFTEGLKNILDEYKQYISNPGISLVRKEAAVLVCSRTVVKTVMALFDKDKDADIDTGKLVDAVFDRFISRGTFSDCEITFSDISKMKKIFKEEKLYYDFLK
jgi:hypothetical protein